MIGWEWKKFHNSWKGRLNVGATNRLPESSTGRYASHGRTGIVLAGKQHRDIAARAGQNEGIAT